MDKDLELLIKNFENEGNDFIVGKRNKIKTIDYKGELLNVKSFAIPFLLKGIMYRYFRSSKAKRSFDYAKILEAKGIGTPKPIAYFENKNSFQLLDSYYVSKHLTPDLVFKDLFDKVFKEQELILKQFAHFCFKLHELGIEFKDHSPGNTLIKKNTEGNYDYFLVDLNRMNFHESMDFDKRMKNLCRITPSKGMVKTIAFEYAKLYKKSEKDVFSLMWKYNIEFQKKNIRKKKLKSIFK
jgi:hypothetical protein